MSYEIFVRHHVTANHRQNRITILSVTRILAMP